MLHLKIYFCKLRDLHNLYCTSNSLKGKCKWKKSKNHPNSSCFVFLWKTLKISTNIHAFIEHFRSQTSQFKYRKESGVPLQIFSVIFSTMMERSQPRGCCSHKVHCRRTLKHTTSHHHKTQGPTHHSTLTHRWVRSPQQPRAPATGTKHRPGRWTQQAPTKC